MAVSQRAPTFDSTAASAFWQLTGDLFVVADADGIIEDVNPACVALLGYAPEELVGTSVTALTHPDDRAAMGAATVASPWPPAEFEARLHCADGDYRALVWSAEQREGRWYAVARARVTEPVTAVSRGQALALHQATLDATQGESVVLDAEGRILLATESWCDFAHGQGYSGVNCGVGADYLGVCDTAGPGDAVAAAVAAGLRELLSGRRESFEIDYPCQTPTELRWFALRARQHHGDGPACAVVSHEDVTDQRRAEHDARMQARLVDEVDAAVVATDADFVVTHVNAAAERMFGFNSEDAIGRPVNETIARGTQVRDDAARGRLAGGEIWELEFTGRRRDGQTFPLSARTATIQDDEGLVTGYVSVVVDLTARVQIENDLRAARDYLRAVTASMGEGLCVIDPSGRLTYMNRAAEQLLGWTFEELNGQVFHDVAHHQRADGSPYQMADCPIDACVRTQKKVRVDDETFVRRGGGHLPVCYVAAPFATEDGAGGTVLVFSDATERRTTQRRMEREIETLIWVGRIRDAIKHDRFELHAQPIVELATGRIVQHELLIRMRDDDDALVSPGAFLPIAEETGVITEIDRWVISEAARFAGGGHAIHLNLSAASVSDRDLPAYIERELKRHGAEAGRIVIELTETAVLSDEDAAEHFISRVKQLGVKLALDDFGTGYGGFTYLKRLPVDCLKIDIEFVGDLATNPSSEHVVRAVVNLANDFGQETVAEGVEDESTLALLRDLGVTFAQGYHIGRPAPALQMLWGDEG